MSFDYFVKAHGIDESMQAFEGVMPKVAEKVGTIGAVSGINTSTIDRDDMLRHDSLEVADFQGLMEEKSESNDAAAGEADADDATA